MEKEPNGSNTAIAGRVCYRELQKHHSQLLSTSHLDIHPVTGIKIIEFSEIMLSLSPSTLLGSLGWPATGRADAFVKPAWLK